MRWSWFLFVLLVTGVTSKGKKHRHHKPGRALLDRLSSDTVSEATVQSEAGGLLPAPLDVAPYSTVTANATCGEVGTEEFCRDTPGKHGVVCDVCEGLDGSSSRRHPPSHATDGDATTWWQSPTLAAGEQYRDVELVATLPDEMELLHVIIKSGPSPRPLAWSLEVSSSESGEDWRMMRAFGDREHCRRLWDLRPERRRRKVRGVKRTNRADKPTCSTQFTSPRPLENGEMHVGVGEGMSAQRVRISLRASHEAPSARRYYTIRALTLVARCLCHGHASRCQVDSQGAKCECRHRTCGRHCHRCCSGIPWSPNSPCPDDGVRCSCGERGACTYDESGAMLCVNCTENRAGPLCDRCLTGYYSELPDAPCLPCNCDPAGSDGTCEWDRRQQKVSCACRPGFTGFLCDACDEPTSVFPYCDAPTTVTPVCNCDARGVDDPSRVCNHVCECKANVVGEKCDTCATGHYGLSASLPEGCRPCYCSHLTDACTAEPQPGDNIVFPLGEAWMVTDGNGNETLEASIDDQGKPYLISYEVEGWETFYWVTTAFSGDRLSAYGGELQTNMFWGIVRGDTGGNPTVGPDVILVAADGVKLTNGNTSHDNPGPVKISVPLLEGNWYAFSDGQTELASRHQLMDVLRDMQAVMLRAYYHMDQDEVRIESVELRGALPNLRERCACPPGYEGANCAQCAWTHARVQHAARATPGFECVPCACNGHAHCDAVDGPCGPCQHNTTGPHCERCLPGHYGNPVQGACNPCACPLYLPSNNFSPNCALASAEGDEFVCTQCPDGYTGDHCEVCDFGYYGSPTTPGSSCRSCACGGAPCDRQTGLCLICPAHTEGARCDQCEEGYWFGPDGPGATGACVPCACGPGALAAACDARSGHCACKEGWRGRTCDRCDVGRGGVEAGCPVCRCGIGAISRNCDTVSGSCECALGSAPPSCETCLEEHYGLDHMGCRGCNCSSVGSESNACDIRTGQCRCKPHVTGRACDTCEEGYWGLQHGRCRRCECGAGAAACDPVSGLCDCAMGVGGDKCDRCLSSYYGFGPAGCLPCPPCTDGKICSPENGRCVCPGKSRGPGCRQCAPGYWARENGCHPCSCGPGSVSETCDSHTGQCKCRSGWTGPQCDTCEDGHFGERCRPCLCSPAGTRGCDTRNCTCDSYGRCPCKENVEGAKCDRCRDGTFGLSIDNPEGCTACFCFGRSAHCTQAGLTRGAVHAPAPFHLTVLLTDAIGPMQMDQDSLLSVHTHTPEPTISVPWPPVPVYVELDKRFLGDKVTSYGGVLKFKVEEEGGEKLPAEILARFPLVRMYAKNIVLEYYERVPPTNGTHYVRLHESLWRVRNGANPLNEPRASRSALMFALQELQHLVVRVTTRAPPYHDRVHVLLLNVSLDTAIPGLSRSEPALGVELCDCPPNYAAPSCQQPAIGFWMPPPRVHKTVISGTIVIRMEGDAQPCNCNNRATACDAETGHCVNCTLGTGGPRCEQCAAGFHGSPTSPGGCQPCPCPTRTRNYADACALTNRVLHCLCKPGYTGPECELCADAYRRFRDGSCVPCECDSRGAVTSQCDARGACRCRAFAAGDRCDQCVARRTYLNEDGCAPCDNCTQTLLDSIENLTSNLLSQADLTELSRIPHPFPALREFATNASILHNSLNHLKKDLELSTRLEGSISDLEATEHRIFTEANALKTEASRRKKEANSLALESMSGLEEVLKARRRLSEQVEALNEFARGEKHLSAHRALKEARQLLRAIKDVKLMDFLAVVNDVFDMANLQSTAIQEYKYRIDDTYRRLRKLQAALDQWEAKADDLNALTNVVWTAGDAVAALEKRVRPKLASVRDVGLRCRLVMEDIASLSANNLTDEVASFLLVARTLSIGFPLLIAELESLALAAEEKEGILYNLTPNYREKYLGAVEKHVAALGEKAKEYKSLFAGTRALAASGVTAANAWSEVAETVREASTAATNAVATASMAAKLAGGPTPLVNTAAKAKEGSDELKIRGAAVLAKAEELRNQLEHLRRGADLVSVILRGLGWQERDLSLRPEASVTSTLTSASEQADRVFGTTRVLYDEAGEVRRRVKYHLRRQLTELQRHGDSALGAAQEHVSQIRGNTVRGTEVTEALAAAAAARAREHDTATASLGPATAALRNKIARARDAADSISVSLSSAAGAPVGCARAYRVPATSPAVTRLALGLSFDGTVKDGVLLYLRDDDQEYENYLKLSVLKNKLHLSWQLGGGEGVTTHPEELQSTHDDADHTSYRLDIERVWNTMRLTVERAGGTPLTSTNSTVPTHSRLRSSRVWLGGVQGAGLPACIHALYCDDKRLGLWNFVEQRKDARCTGCTQRWYNTGRAGSGEPTLVWFNGEGYAEVRRSGRRPSDRRQFSLAFTFRTRDEDALLFMAVDSTNNRSVCVRMRSCRVELDVQYSDARLRIAAGGRHCHGRAVHVQAIRVFAANQLERGSLRVNGEETLGSPSPPVQSAAALPDLSTATYWIAGAPPGGQTPAPPLLGCIGALTVDREGYDLLNTPKRHGVESRCGARTLRSAILEGKGHIELPSPVFRRKAALGISFRARSPNGLLVFRAPSSLADNEVDDDDGDDRHYLALMLVEGELELIAAAGKSELRLRTNATRFDDGRLHTVRVVRIHKQLELWVNEQKLVAGPLPGNALPARNRGLYVGGLPLDVTSQGIGRGPHFNTTGFTGTVADLIVDAALIGYENAVNWSGARLGRADSEPATEPRTEPRALQAQPDKTADCTKTPSYTVEAGAVKFGDAPFSHAILKLPARAKELAIAMQFRTFTSDGVLLLIPGSKAKPKHYLALMVREGKLKLVVRGRKRREVGLPAIVNDGTWRAVSIRASRSRLVVASGGAAGRAHAPPAARAARVYVGGLPAPPALPALPNAIIRVGAFRGCIRRVVVNGRAEDLVRDAATHHRVGQCFPTVERGAYFGGDAYAIWSNTWSNDGSSEASSELRLQFRSYAPSGVLVATTGLVIELKDGSVMLSRTWSGSTAPLRLVARGASNRALCDGAWHYIVARVPASGGATLSLDASPAHRAQPHALLDDVVTTPSRPDVLYIGGLPGCGILSDIFPLRYGMACFKKALKRIVCGRQYICIGDEGVIDITDDGKENFKGCLRDVTVGGHSKDWVVMETLHNVLLDSCPVQQ